MTATMSSWAQVPTLGGFWHRRRIHVAGFCRLTRACWLPREHRSAILLHNSRRCLFFSRHTSQLSPRDLAFACCLERENLGLRHQIGALPRSTKRPKLTSGGRLLWICRSRLWCDWRSALATSRQTVLAGHRASFRLFWTWKVRRGQPGRPAVSREVTKPAAIHPISGLLWPSNLNMRV